MHKLALLDIDPAGASKTASQLTQLAADIEILRVTVDLAKEESIVKGIQEVVDRFGRIDVALNIAGMPGSLKPSTEISAEEFRKVVDVNMVGLWIAQREEVRHMLRQEGVKRGSVCSVLLWFLDCCEVQGDVLI